VQLNHEKEGFVNQERVAWLVKELLRELGEDSEREGLLKTPERVAKSLAFLTKGYRGNLTEIINNAFFASTERSMVLVQNIEIYSLCEHHMLPFYGHCHIGYVPKGKVLGVSKLARIAEHYARRLQIQERLTFQIAQEVMKQVDAEGVGVLMECRHLCMMMRGVEKRCSVMKTLSTLGSFGENADIRRDFLHLLEKSPV